MQLWGIPTFKEQAEQRLIKEFERWKIMEVISQKMKDEKPQIKGSNEVKC